MPEALGQPITMHSGRLSVPETPIVPFIEGDGTGPDIWRASKLVFDAAVEKAYGGKRSIAWLEVLAGEKAFTQTGEWLPDATLDAFRQYLVGIKGPLTTPVGGGIRSLNVALRQMLDLYVCLRPVQYFTGVPSPVQAARADRHGHLPREHRGHLRGDRVRARHRGLRQGEVALRRGVPRPLEEGPLPRNRRHRHQARQPGGDRPAGQGGHPVRDRQRPKSRSRWSTRGTS